MVNKAELKKQMLFSELTDEELDMIAKKIADEQYSKGKPIFRAGEATKGIYLVKSGKVEISLLTADGWKQPLAVLSENQIFGELSVIEDKKTHGANATAIEDTAVFRIT
ncbi:MAG TPA: cyclic nucleotide-binding domain-containing protein, partial [Nitrospirota bacterium]|nr:cyclic nucleotide-binding domain-containing protein [Nitrospirota bacterium]